MKTSNLRSKMLGTRVTEEIYALLEQLVQAQGLTVSEYLRQLIIRDLEAKYRFLTAKIQGNRGW